MNYDTWVKSVPLEITADPLWKVEAYRLALFAGDLGWRDQLYRALGSRSIGTATTNRARTLITHHASH
jgi:hypothetical protein